MARIDISHDRTRLTFAPTEGGRIAQVWFDDRPLLVDLRNGIDSFFGWGCYPMVPWAGRLADGRFGFRGDAVAFEPNNDAHALHGLGLLHSWIIVAESRSSLVVRLDLEHVGWPFGGWCEQRISLGPSSLHLEMSIETLNREFPAQIGWHPWFAPPESLDVEFSVMYPRDVRGLTSALGVPPREEPWDDCFAKPLHDPRLVVNGTMITLSSTCNYWVVYTLDPNGVCIEPQSGIPNAFNTIDEQHLDVVGPTRPLRHSFHWEFAN